jgi:MurNAc alpha-1-phosphate uridylyltransferase
MKIETGMVLAAGKGERLRPLTDACPKPLIVVGGRSMIDRIIDELEKAKVKKVVVNVCYHGDMIMSHLEKRTKPKIIFSEEIERLETGGGVLNALPQLGKHPFFVMNGDILWADMNNSSVLETLKKAWNDKMDALLLMVPIKNVQGYKGNGDFKMNSKGHLERPLPDKKASYVHVGMQILHPRLFEGEEIEPFSLNKLYNKAQEKGTLYGVEHKGLWFHVGTPEALVETRAWFAEHQATA